MSDQYISNILQDALTIIEAMSGREFELSGPSQIAEMTGVDKNKVFRILVNLEKRNWVESENGMYRLSPWLTRFSERFSRAVAQRAKDLRQEAERYLGDLDA